jgi:Coenzyme PQQ synthesis protein D (PqqD)
MSSLLLCDKSRIAASKDQVSCDLAGDAAMLSDQVSCDSPGEAAILNLKNGIYFSLDSVGAAVWRLIQQPKTFAEIREHLLHEYAVDRPRLESDLRELLAQLQKHGLIEVTQ